MSVRVVAQRDDDGGAPRAKRQRTQEPAAAAAPAVAAGPAAPAAVTVPAAIVVAVNRRGWCVSCLNALPSCVLKSLLCVQYRDHFRR